MSEQLEGAAHGLSAVTHRTRSGDVLVELTGELGDAALDEAALTRSLLDAADDGRSVVVDLGGVRSMGVRAVEILLQAERRLHARGGSMQLLDPTPEIVLLLHDVAIEADGPAVDRR